MYVRLAGSFYTFVESAFISKFTGRYKSVCAAHINMSIITSIPYRITWPVLRVNVSSLPIPVSEQVLEVMFLQAMGSFRSFWMVLIRVYSGKSPNESTSNVSFCLLPIR